MNIRRERLNEKQTSEKTLYAFSMKFNNRIPILVVSYNALYKYLDMQFSVYSFCQWYCHVMFADKNSIMV